MTEYLCIVRMESSSTLLGPEVHDLESSRLQMRSVLVKMVYCMLVIVRTIASKSFNKLKMAALFDNLGMKS